MLVVLLCTSKRVKQKKITASKMTTTRMAYNSKYLFLFNKEIYNYYKYLFNSTPISNSAGTYTLRNLFATTYTIMACLYSKLMFSSFLLALAPLTRF